jgi:hypothetical protein
VSDYDYGDDWLDNPDIAASASITTRDLTDDEIAELKEREQRRLPFGFQPPKEDTP